jgi:glycosidase
VREEGFLQSGSEHYACGPRLHEYLKEIGGLLREFDAFSVGEMPGVHDEREIVKAVGQERGELAMAFQFDVVGMDHMPEGKWLPRRFRPSMLREVVSKWQRFMLENGGWNALYMENHDQGRTVSRYASDEPELRMVSAKMLAAHLALQCGTVFVYQGQELGMANMPRDWGVDKYKDIEMRNHWEGVLRDHPNDEKLQMMYKDQYRVLGRDNARTPMQWNGSKNAGFMPEGGEPWMSIHPDYEKWNAESIVQDKDSSFHYWRKLLDWRKTEKDLFVYGDFEMLDLENQHEEVIAYVRTEDSKSDTKKRAMVITSFSKENVWWPVPEQQVPILFDGERLKTEVVVKELGNYSSDIEVKDRAIRLRPLEVLIMMTE